VDLVQTMDLGGYETRGGGGGVSFDLTPCLNLILCVGSFLCKFNFQIIVQAPSMSSPVDCRVNYMASTSRHVSSSDFLLERSLETQFVLHCGPITSSVDALAFSMMWVNVGRRFIKGVCYIH
jgi:hypothetical protein